MHIFAVDKKTCTTLIYIIIIYILALKRCENDIYKLI